MKLKVTEKQIKGSYKNIISVGYCDIAHLTRGIEPRYYTAGVYGWNADIYEIDSSTVIVTGYRPFGNIHASYNGICQKYDEKAREISRDYSIDYQKQQEKINKLLTKFVTEALNK